MLNEFHLFQYLVLVLEYFSKSLYLCLSTFINPVLVLVFFQVLVHKYFCPVLDPSRTLYPRNHTYSRTCKSDLSLGFFVTAQCDSNIHILCGLMQVLYYVPISTPDPSIEPDSKTLNHSCGNTIIDALWSWFAKYFTKC